MVIPAEPEKPENGRTHIYRFSMFSGHLANFPCG